MTRLKWLLTGGSAALLAGSSALGASGVDPHAPNFDAYSQAPAVRRAASPSELPRAVVSSWDTQRNVPTFVWAARDDHQAMPSTNDPSRAALRYLERYAGYYGLTRDALDSVVVRRVFDQGRGGIIVVLEQELDGLEVMSNRLNVLMTRDLRLVALSGNLHSALSYEDSRLPRTFDLSEADAISFALEDMWGFVVAPSSLRETGEFKDGYRYFVLNSDDSGVRLTTPVRVKPVLYPMPDRLMPAYTMELMLAREDSPTSDAFAYVISAQSGEMLKRTNLTQSAAFNYTVWADTTGEKRPYAGPISDYFPHPTGIPDGTWPEFIPPNVISVEGLNTNPDGGTDPWLPDNATDTRGNNADAYADQYLPDGYSQGDFRATTTSDYTFDRVYDTSAEPLVSTDQSMASVTHAFYVVNWLHDYYYDSGFNEENGNAQLDNYGRGGVDGDRMLVEVQDMAQAGVRNNAFMTTSAEGSSPRMAMFLWTGGGEQWVEVPGSDEPMDAGYADFGTQEFDLTQYLVLADDGTDTPTDACEPIINDVTGKIAVIDRGICDFQSKASKAEAAGAIGVLIVNNVEGEGYLNMAASDPNEELTVAALSVSYEDGSVLKSMMANTDTQLHMYRQKWVERDGAIDPMVVSHEWAHYLHHRLVLDCANQQCGAESEGWGDFVALSEQLREGDAFDGTYSDTQYVSIEMGNAYFGIRRLPYSTDFTKNAFTFRHIQDGEPLPELEYTNYFAIENSETHNSGEIWAMMMWESYFSLLSRTQGADAVYDFDQASRLMADYVVAGMIMAPKDPTFTEQRDALLAVASANDSDDAMLIAEGFARRGAGSCAESPPRDSEDLIGVVESYVVAPKLELVSLDLDDSVLSCDEDDVLDATETGLITVKVQNDGLAPMIDTQVTISTTTPGISFPYGGIATLDDVEGFGSGTVTFPITADASFSEISYLDLTLELSNSSACTPESLHEYSIRINYDNMAGTSANDDAESDLVAWTETVSDGPSIWSRLQTTEDNHVYYAWSPEELTDVRFTSPELEVGTSDYPVITFEHRYEFEASPLEEGGPDIYWDGAVIEISSDGGKTWADVNTLADPDYQGKIYSSSSNALAGRDAYVGTNPSWPAMDTEVLELGRTLAGKTVQLRFRFAGDEMVGTYGWEIDNISVQGIDNTPFPSIVADSSSDTTYYQDLDGDGYGDPDVTATGCPAPDGYVALGGDCDDYDATTYPGADEPADGVDHNCDGEVTTDPGCGQRGVLPRSGLPAAFPLLSFVAVGLVIRRRRSNHR